MFNMFCTKHLLSFVNVCSECVIERQQQERKLLKEKDMQTANPLDEGAIIDLADRILGRLGMDDHILEFANALFEAYRKE
jgi:hypothetical protein